MLQLNYNENGNPSARLRLQKNGFLSRVPMHACAISILTGAARERAEVEDFIASIYAHTYDADISVYYDTLMSVRDDHGDIVAALGFRSAGHGPLFLEQYLRRPINSLLGIPRHQIAEIGNLASNGSGASSFLFTALSAYLHHGGFKQAVVTGTDTLEKRLRKMGLEPIRHALADPALLECGNTHWGRYYDTRPHVLSGSVTLGYLRLQSRFGAEYHHMRPRLYPQFQHNGEV
ncbi:thermostable hemolysin [Thalassospira sp.]|uniref:thermostable hemolysin n=1 Tax=Thalassospira sp. TaxID=1912094 RepID=UPI000C520F3B|nr:thermostable hemolysin [Thalassospira sp.]MBC07127.1 hypothetical protein [Thalassospira sp.]|tara:strand:+ start:152 stop:850 length:699 start_codon:yes stop_codon:yes gene_type:complete